jgi:NADPH:quinone reductase-like Zn-dependent oxidoreductase
MKLFQLVRYGTLDEAHEFGEAPMPEPGDDEVLVKVAGAGINPLDCKIASGAMQARRPLDLPRIVGFDVSGDIVATGSAVTGFEAGEAVLAYVGTMGTVAEYALAKQDELAKRPQELPETDAAGLPLAALTACQSLFDIANIQKDENILVHAGSGGVGSFAIQLAKLRGAYVATTTSSVNTGWVGELGADLVIDYTAQDYRDVVSNYDVVLDTLGGPVTMDSFDVIKTGGRVVSLAGAMDRDTAGKIGMTLPPDAEEVNDAADAKDALYRFTRVVPNGAQLAEIVQWCTEGLVKPVIDKIYPFADSKQAFAHLASGRAKGKIVISLSE